MPASAISPKGTPTPAPIAAPFVLLPPLEAGFVVAEEVGVVVAAELLDVLVADEEVDVVEADEDV